MKNKIYNLFIILMGIFLASSISSCSKDEDKVSLPTLEISQSESGPVAITYTDVLKSGGYTYKYTIKLDKSATTAMLCNVSTDSASALVEDYNIKHNTSYKLMPSSVYTLIGTDGIIKAGELESDTLSVLFKSLYGLVSGEEYLLPIVAKPDEMCANQFGTSDKSISYISINIDGKLDYIVGLNMSSRLSSMYTTLNLPNNEVVTIDGNTHTFEMMIFPYTWNSSTNYIGTWRGNDLNNSNEAFSGCEFRVTGTTGVTNTGNRQCDLTTTTSGVIIPANQWSLLTVTCDGTMTGQNTQVAYRMYINGVLVASKAPTKRYGTTSSQKFKVGYSLTGIRFGYGSASYYFDGLISEIRMWKKCLTQDEIKANLREVVSPSSTDMYGYWKINEGTGNTLKDYSGNGRDLTFPSTSTISWTAEYNSNLSNQ
jgi:hypothetical protein